MHKVVFALCAAVLCLAACNSPENRTAGDQKTIDSLKAIVNEDHSSETAALMSADSAWDRASEAKSADGWLAFYADDAVMMPPGGKVCADNASREASIKGMFAVPGVSLRFQGTKVEVSRSGDLGYTIGVYQWKSKSPKGKDYHETGKFCETWKKQPDQGWKCIVDIWNADPAK